ncbi:hypothetical protein [Rheinheimera aquimaris]|uniref:hypothetical protein n=1 Tax=Rheinheimera aquimaris TaxID=412437 RepID=UPI001E4AC42E|nr:hypothetical protein [Rheinheimera aquimaris]MCD1597221.1 hypothetical protein [Rheinheimera aquimaris]
MRLLLCLLLLTPLCQAAPLRLTLQPSPQQMLFSYQFDLAGYPQQLSFSINNNTLNSHFRQFRALKPALLQQYLWRDLRAHVAQYPGARLQRLPGKDALHYKLLVADSHLLDKVDTELQQLISERTAFYLQQQYYYVQDLPWNARAIIPDHARIMQDSLQDLLPVATAWHGKLANVPTRQALLTLSAWIQQIPYQDLSDRQRSSGASFNPPLKLLQENRGDCDSKAVLLAALLRMLLPDVKLAMVYLPQHAVLAVQLQVTPEDMTVNIEGRDYLLVDATGPALLTPGQINPEYQIYTGSGQFGYQLL